MGLYVDGPSTSSQKVAGGGANQTISGTFDTGNAPNGTFTVTLKGEITGTRYDSVTFKLRRPADTPSNVEANLQGTSKVVVTWSKGAEPDLQAYQVSNTQSGVVGRLSADSACSGGSCKAVLAVPAKAAGQKVGFTVKAFRSDGDGGTVGSGESGAAYVSVPAPPAAQPKKEVDRTQQTPPKVSKETKKVDPLPTLPAKKQTLPSSQATVHKPKATAKAPAMPDTDAEGNLPIPSADARQGEDGGLTPSGGAGDGDNRATGEGDGAGNGRDGDGKDSATVQVDGVKAQAGESALGNVGQYGLYVAGGLLLLLLGAHAGAWARRRALAGEGGGGRAPALGAQPVAASGAGSPSGTGAAVGLRTEAAAGLAAGAEGLRGAAGDVATSAGAGAGALAGAGTGAGAAASRRRPTVILAVAKTRMPQAERENPARGEAPGGRGQGAGRVEPAVGGRRVDEPERLPLGASEGPGDAAERPGKDGREGRQEPVRIALPSSAVIDVSEPSEAVPPQPAVRIEERWDDYLPPSPRSMEDSGFWERPLPGALDFWAPDDEGKGEIGNADGTANGKGNGTRAGAEAGAGAGKTASARRRHQDGLS
ncbi:hypothetical protein MF672_012355 [Actinomadura sp. ATCC 31491]|uniref:Fibronectin type-III domain-containing protein n=1 Tax=Actinomadura luzonensis TaxID=2805427 RepID=A0ABT0FRN0_9ACTN|nr:hypothetical protein [Actinomadura luzonensis]MCK2214576.1 hypothetical protein [Actinomadura luzonensis]